MTQQLARSTMERVALRLRSSSTRPSLSRSIAFDARVGGTVVAVAPSGGARAISTTRVTPAQRQNRSSEATEALLAQQMLDFMALADEDAGGASGDGLKSELPVTGVIMDVKNNIASISGLRHATIGSVVTISSSNVDDDDAAKDASAADEPLCRGVVLFLEKKVAHVALFSERSKTQAVRLVQPGMTVALESEQLEIPVGVAKLVGKAVDPLGEPIELVYQNDADAETPADEFSGTERISVAWGSKTVPGLMQRAPLKDPLATGILAIDCFKPLAFGHRFGILGPRNSGKTRVMLDIISHQVKTSLAAGVEPPHFVYVCVGKSQMRVQQILQFLEQTGAMPYTTIVSADERDSLIKQYLAPFSGCAIAEYFMRQHKSRKSVVVYDDLATHTTVVENLVLTMKLPRISQLSLSAHEILMERSAALVDQLGAKSLTTFVLADAPDSSLGETTAFQQKIISIVDDAVGLEGQLALNRVYPPVDVLTPGGSIRGPPFQSAALWKYTTKLRALVNDASRTHANVEVAKKLGFEVEPDDLEVLELQELVRQFFVQKPLTEVAQIEREVGLFFLTGVQVRRLPAGLEIWDFLRDVMQLLEQEAPELLHLLKSHPREQPWPQYAEDELTKVFATHLVKLRKERQSERKRR
ncbi:Atpase [Globisporangium polare]